MVLCVVVCVAGITHAAKVDRIEPTDWYVGMKNPSLQLMIYGKDVRDAQVTVDYPGVTIDSLVRQDSPSYLLVYLNVADAKAGEMVLKIDKQRVKYQLKQREKRGEERIGFTCADVLYQLMPDRFASGTVENDQLITMNRYQCDRSNPNLRHGGGLEGIRQHLDYFNELGVTALWFTPVLENNSPDRDGASTYHGYAPTNYYRIYNSFVYDYLYPNPSSVLAFIENHDTDRYLGDGMDTLALKQALALLLTVNRIPQLYYGVEILMNGTKTQSDGNVRQDFPGGFWDDTRNAFTADGRTDAENSMFRWLSRLLHWRQGSEVITKGTMTQFIPHRGIYVVVRQYKGKTVMTILNGTPYVTTLPVSRYAEVIGNHRQAKNIFCGCAIDLTKDIQLQPRESLIIEF